MKKFLPVLMTAIFLLLPLKINVSAKSFEIEKLKENVTIAENGDVHVEEELTYYFDGDYNGVYRTLSKNGASGYTISEVLVKDNNNIATVMQESNSGMDNTYEVTDSSSECKLKIYSKSSNEGKTFILRYTIHGAVVKTVETGELYWSFYNVENGASIKDFEVNISLKDAEFDQNKFKHWAYIDGTNLSDSYDSKNIQIKGSNLTGTLGVRVLFQPEFLNISVRENIENQNSDSQNPGKGNVTTIEENAQNNKVKVGLKTENQNEAVGIVLLMLGLAASLGITMYIVASHRRFTAALEAYRAQMIPFNQDMLYNPPSDLPPALVNYLLNESYICDAVIPATLFYLSKLGFYSFTAQTYTKDTLFKKTEDTDLVFKRNYEKMMPNSLHLQYFIDWMSAYEDNGSFSLKGIQEKIESSSEASKFEDSYSHFQKTIRQEADNLGFFTMIEKKKVLSNRYYEEKLKWLAYKKFLQRYINDEKLITMEDLDGALIYGSVLGIYDYEMQELLKKAKGFSFDNNDPHSNFNNLNYNMHDKVHSNLNNGMFNSMYYDNFMFYNLYFTNYHIWNDIQYDIQHHHSSDLDNNNNFFGGDDSGFGGFSAGGGDSFSGGGGGDSGAF